MPKKGKKKKKKKGGDAQVEGKMHEKAQVTHEALDGLNTIYCLSVYDFFVHLCVTLSPCSGTLVRNESFLHEGPITETVR